MLPQKISTFAEIYDSVLMRFPNDADGGGSYDEREERESGERGGERKREGGEGRELAARTDKERKEREERKSEGGRVDEERRRYLVED